MRLLESLATPRQEEVGTVAVSGLALFEASSSPFCVPTLSMTVTNHRQDDIH